MYPCMFVLCHPSLAVFLYFTGRLWAHRTLKWDFPVLQWGELNEMKPNVAVFA